MRITKIGHSCLLVEEGETRLLFDPGKYSTAQNELTGLSAIFITHQHQDHTDPDSIRIILSKNPGIPIYTNQGVIGVLTQSGLTAELFEYGIKTLDSMSIEARTDSHALIHSSVPVTPNTSFFVNNELYITGDTVEAPFRDSARVVALPVCAPWLRLADAINMAVKAKPELCFPVHDGWFKDFYGPFHELPMKVLGEQGIKFIPLKPGQSVEVE